MSKNLSTNLKTIIFNRKFWPDNFPNIFMKDAEIVEIIKSDNVEKLSGAIASQSDADRKLEVDDNNLPTELRDEAPLVSAAAFFGSVKCYNYLVEKGADIHALDENELSVLQFAIHGGSHEIIKSVIDAGISVPYIGFYALRMQKYDTFFWMVENKYVNLSDLDFLKSSYLHIVSQTGNTDAFKKLMELHKFDVNLKDYQGRTALHYACGEGYKEIVEILMKDPNIDPSIEDNFNRIAVYYAHSQGNWDIVNIFFNGNVNGFLDNGQTHLMVASRKGNINLVRFLLEIPEVDINIQNSYGLAALHFAARFGEYEIVEELLGHKGIKINVQDKQGKTALHYAKEANNEDIIALLLKKGADPNIVDNEGHKPLEEIENFDPNKK